MLISINDYHQIHKEDNEVKSADVVMTENFLVKIRSLSFYELNVEMLNQKIIVIC